MSIPRFTNPGRGDIHPKKWPRPAGNTDLECFQTVQDHLNRGADPALDLSRGGQCGSPILNIARGKCYAAGVDHAYGDAIFAAFDHGNGWRSMHYHLAAEFVTVGVWYDRGAKIGTMGDTGFAQGCHDHFGMKRLVNGVWVRDTKVWQRLAQNRARVTDAGVFLRDEPHMGAAHKYAVATADGIVRLSDKKVVGGLAEYFALRGDGSSNSQHQVTGDKYVVPVNGVPTAGDQWEQVWVDGRYLFIAKPLTVRGTPN